MRWFILAAASALTACAHQSGPDEAMLEKQRLEAQKNAIFATVEEHAGCAGFHRANAGLASDNESKATFYTTAASNAEIAATEIASSEVSKDLAVEMVNNLAEIHAAEWAYAIESKTRQEAVSSQADKCQILAEQQKDVVRNIVKAKYGFKKQ